MLPKGNRILPEGGTTTFSYRACPHHGTPPPIKSVSDQLQGQQKQASILKFTERSLSVHNSDSIQATNTAVRPHRLKNSQVCRPDLYQGPGYGVGVWLWPRPRWLRGRVTLRGPGVGRRRRSGPEKAHRVRQSHAAASTSSCDAHVGTTLFYYCFSLKRLFGLCLLTSESVQPFQFLVEKSKLGELTPPLPDPSAAAARKPREPPP